MESLLLAGKNMSTDRVSSQTHPMLLTGTRVASIGRELGTDQTEVHCGCWSAGIYFRLCHIALAVMCGLILAGCGRVKDPRPGADRSRQPVPVTVAPVVSKDVPVELRAIGTVRPYATVPVKSRVDGQVAKIAFTQGAHVKEGDLLVQIDPRPYEAARNQAAAILERDKALLENAVIEMRRTDELSGTKAVPASQIDANRARVANLRATVAADQAALDLADLQLSFCSIRAPVSGRAGIRLVDEGAMVRNNDTTLVVINQTRPVYIDFAVPEQSLHEIRRAAQQRPLQVEVTTPQLGLRSVHGELAVINNEVDTSTGTVLVRAVCPNTEEELWPGQFVSVTLRLSVLSNAVVVPSQAVQVSQNGEFVFVVNSDQTVARKPVKTAQQWAGYTVISDGLVPGESVVTDGHLRLVPGSKIKVTPPVSVLAGRTNSAEPMAGTGPRQGSPGLFSETPTASALGSNRPEPERIHESASAPAQTMPVESK